MAEATTSIRPCVFCRRLLIGPFIASNELAVAFEDAFPLSRGHSLIIPRRHQPDFLALEPDEQEAVWALLPEVTAFIERAGTPDGYNIGINVNTAAGQTVAHAHVHLIPRHEGDVPDARGGVRWVLPTKARYWETP